jgi:hypothetical protein
MNPLDEEMNFRFECSSILIIEINPDIMPELIFKQLDLK